MRVALVFKRLSLHGGSERQFAALARGLNETGHEVHVFCQSVRMPPPPGVVVHSMPRVPLGSLAGQLAFSAWARIAIRRAEDRDGAFDVSHAFGRTRGQDVYRVGGGCHRTYLDHAHALDRPEWARRWLRRSPGQQLKARLEEQSLRGPPPPRVITNSDMVRRDLIDRYALHEGRVHVVRNGVDLERFRPPANEERHRLRVRWGLPRQAPVVLFLGTGYARKGLEVLLRAMAHVARALPDVELVVAGRDRRLRNWQRLAESVRVAGRVRWAGSVAEPELLYRAADVHALPTCYDPAANGTLEALASGLPVVTTTMNGTSEIVTEHSGTVLPTPVEPSELAEALLHWLTTADPKEAGLRARAAAEAHAEHDSLRAILDVYRSVLEDRAERRRSC